MIDLPAAPPMPCNECPWRRQSTPGHLGMLDPDEWIELVHSDAPMACHMTVKPGSGIVPQDLTIEEIEAIMEETWADPSIRQCRGAAIFRRHVLKSPRNPTDAAHRSSSAIDVVFSTDREFLHHHQE